MALRKVKLVLLTMIIGHLLTLFKSDLILKFLVQPCHYVIEYVSLF